MIEIQNYSIKENLFESESFSIYQVTEKNNQNILISKVIKQPIKDKELTLQQLEFFLTIHHPSFLPLIGFSLIDFHQNPYLTIICDNFSCIPYQKYTETTEFTEEAKTRIYLACLSLFNYFKIRHSILFTFSMNEFLICQNRHTIPYVIFLPFELPNSNDRKIDETETVFLSKIQSELKLKEIKEIDDFEFKKLLFLNLNEEERNDLRLSIGGDIEKCLEVGKNFLNGTNNFPKNEDEGIHFLKEAAEKGNTESQVILSALFSGNPTMRQESFHYCLMAAKSGHFGAISNLGVYLLRGDQITQNSEEAVKCFEIAAKHGIDQAILNYAYCLSKGIGVGKDVKKSLKYYKIAADKNVVPGALKYIELVDDRTEKIKYSQKVADLGFSEGFSMLGDLTGNKAYYQKAAELGNAEAATKFAYQLTKKGEIEEALKYYEFAARRKDSTAIYNYLLLLEQNGQLTNEKMSEIVGFYRSAIESGDIQSMLNLAEIFEDGNQFVGRDLDEALKLYRLASDLGNPEGSLNYARVLEVIKSDIQGAIEFYQAAIDNGSNEAFVCIARCLLKIGGDPGVILELINRSVELGSAEAMFMLGMMHAEGKLVERNKEEARRLLLEADENGFETESPTIQEIVDSL